MWRVVKITTHTSWDKPPFTELIVQNMMHTLDLDT